MKRQQKGEKMDLSAIVTTFQSHAGAYVIVITILFVISEVLGSVPSIKASSIYGLISALLTTLKDQATPQQPKS